jgi:hypothetical protein
MLFRETVAVHCENHTEHTDTLCGGRMQFFFIVKANGAYANHCAFHGYCHGHRRRGGKENEPASAPPEFSGGGGGEWKLKENGNITNMNTKNEMHV